MYCQDTFQYLRIKSVLRKLKIDMIGLIEDMEPRDMGHWFNVYKNDPNGLLLMTEAYYLQRRTPLRCNRLIFAGPPIQRSVFEQLCQSCDGEIILLHVGAEDQVRLLNIFTPSEAKEIMKSRIWEK